MGVTTSSGMALRFVAPREHSDTARRYYEPHIAQTGEVKTRTQSWHDLFNALAWITFPLAKAAINAQHVAILQERGDAEAKRRGPERDALTLFDESGVIVATDDASLTQLIVDFEWKELFWRRPRGARTAHAFLHVRPRVVRESARALHRDGRQDRVRAVRRGCGEADALLAAHFSERSRFPRPKSMAPMPVLGVPGWDPRNADEAFYDDESHFRGKRA